MSFLHLQFLICACACRTSLLAQSVFNEARAGAPKGCDAKKTAKDEGRGKEKSREDGGVQWVEVVYKRFDVYLLGVGVA